MSEDTETEQELIEAAIGARKHAYAPYSNFQVGAALLSKNGNIHTGCNVENLSYGLTICAERNAITTAVGCGETEFLKMVIVAETGEPVSPCGACRQFMAEFGNFPILSLNLDGDQFESTVDDLLPRAKTGILDKKP